MGETETLLLETARVAGAEAVDAARGATDPAAEASCRRIRDEARARLGGAGDAERGAVTPCTPDRGIHSAALGMIALTAVLARCPDAEPDARALAARLLVLLRGIQEEIVRASGPPRRGGPEAG